MIVVNFEPHEIVKNNYKISQPTPYFGKKDEKQ